MLEQEHVEDTTQQRQQQPVDRGFHGRILTSARKITGTRSMPIHHAQKALSGMRVSHIEQL
jgi:hypothetical protein